MGNMATRRFLIPFLRNYMSTLGTVAGSGIIIRCSSNLSRHETPTELRYELYILSGMKEAARHFVMYPACHQISLFCVVQTLQLCRLKQNILWRGA
jgi:hypothetical protein